MLIVFLKFLDYFDAKRYRLLMHVIKHIAKLAMF